MNNNSLISNRLSTVSLVHLNDLESGRKLSSILSCNIKRFRSDLLFNIDKLYFKDQGRVCRDRSACNRTVSDIRWYSKDRFITNVKKSNTFIPSFDHLANTKSELNRLASFYRAVKNGIVRKLACVVNSNHVTSF